MRFFMPQVEIAFKTIGVITLIGLLIMPVAWGYEQRRQARTWQSIACAYRIKEIARQAPFVAGVDYGRDPCQVLARWGVELLPQR